MKKYTAIIFALAFFFTVGLLGCEKKQEPPKPTSQPVTIPETPAPAPEAAPAPAPAPAKPAKK
jgi:hypothetical protein